MNWILLRQDKNIHFKQDRTVTLLSHLLQLLFYLIFTHSEATFNLKDYKISF